MPQSGAVAGEPWWRLVCIWMLLGGGAFGAFCRDAVCVVPTTKEFPGRAACGAIIPTARGVPGCGALPKLRDGICFSALWKDKGKSVNQISKGNLLKQQGHLQKEAR